MRVTTSMYYKSLQDRSSKMNERLFDVNKQISSGLKIQYAKDDVGVFVETMRLDNEVTTLKQVEKSTQNGFKMSNQADSVLSEFQTSMKRMRTLFIQAANDTNDDTSRNAIAKELRGIESGLKSLANTSINGQYIFAGSATGTKPIRESDGRYMGNDVSMSAFIGSGVKQAYNITGAELFLGEERAIKREISTNAVTKVNNPSNGSSGLSESVTMKEFMGDTPSGKHYFYLRGVKHNGDIFHKKIEMTNDETLGNLLRKIAQQYGNTADKSVVNVELSPQGQIVIKDKVSGSSKLDFHLVGVSDFNNDATDHANVSHIDNLSSGVSDYHDASTNGKLYIREFLKSGLSNADGVNGLEGNLYDRVKFAQDGTRLTGSVAQIVKQTHVVDENGQKVETIKDDEINSFAKPSTLLSEVFDTSSGSLDGIDLVLKGDDINGNSYSVEINLKNTTNGGSTFKVSGHDYKIYNTDNPRSAVDADKMTYQQLLDVLNMVVSNTLPSDDTVAKYDQAIESANLKSNTYLTYDGKIEFDDLSATSQTKASISLYDKNSGDFSGNSAVASFNANNALTIRDPKTDFFKTIDEMIKSVEEYKKYPNPDVANARTVGIEHAIVMLDDLMDHVERSHSLVGAQSNALEQSLERTQTLQVSTMTLRSSVVDTDLAKASLDLTQLMNNFQAMLSTVGKISKLTLVNYL